MKSTVVFIHAFPFSREMWRPQLAALEGVCPTLAYDVRGFGESDPGDGQVTVEFWADELLTVLDKAGIQKAVVCGLSMGGYIALRAMEKFPERFKALILADTRSEADTDEAKIKRAATIQAIKKDGLAKFADGFLGNAFAVPVDGAKEMILKNTSIGVTGAVLALAARTDTTAGLSKIQVPTLILVGDQDKLTPVAASESLHSKIKASKLEVIPRAGHISNLENPKAFNEALKRFISTLSS